MKKLISLFLALMMVLSLAATAFATDADPSEPPQQSTEGMKGKITINGVSNGNTYRIYKLLDLISFSTAGEGAYSYLDLFLGNIGGSMGEICTLAILLGGIYLVARRVISPIIPVVYLGTAAVMSLILGLDPLYQLMSGGIVLGAVFMATDYVTSPITKWGKVIFGVGLGILTMLIRTYSNLPEGVSFAILLMNILVPHIEKLTKPKSFGEAKKEKGEKV